MLKKQKLSALWLAVLVVGCSSDNYTYSPSAPRPPIAPPPAASDPIYYHSVAPIYGGAQGAMVGSLYVVFDASCEYPNLHACLQSVTRDGAPATANYIKSGQLVEMFARTLERDGTASFDIQRAVVGLVESVDAPHSQLLVLGQRIFVDGLTQGDALDLSSIVAGDRVAVSGFFTVDGQIVATRIDHDTEAGPLILRGVLRLDSNDQLSIGSMPVDISAASLEEFPGGAPLPGDAVLIFAEQAQDGVLVAQTARYTGGNWSASNMQPVGVGLLSGFVTDARSTTDFDIAGITIQANTCESCDALAKPVTVGAFVKATTNAGSVWMADAVVVKDCCHHFIPDGYTVLMAAIESVDPTGAEITVLGTQLRISPATRIVESIEASVGSGVLRVEELEVGDTVTAAVLIRDDVVSAHLIAREGVGIQIRADYYDFSFSAPVISFLDLAILTDSATPVTFCSFNHGCVIKDQAWLFSSPFGYEYDSIMWTIDIDANAVPLQATAVSVWAY